VRNGGDEEVNIHTTRALVHSTLVWRMGRDINACLLAVARAHCKEHKW